MNKISINDIEKFVKLGYSQKAENCKILLYEIYRLREENNKLKNKIKGQSYE